MKLGPRFFRPDYPQIAQCEQRVQLCRVLGQPAVSHLHEPEVPLDHPQRMLDLGTHAGLELLDLVDQGIDLIALVQRLAFARAHGNVPGDVLPDTGALVCALVARIPMDRRFPSMQQSVGLGRVVHIGRRSDHRMYQPRVGIHTDVCLDTKVPLVALLGLVYLGVTSTVFVLGVTGRSNQVGRHYGARLEQQAVGAQLGISDLQDLGAQVVLFEQMTKSQDADPIRNLLGAADAHEVTVEAGLEQCFFGPQGRTNQTTAAGSKYAASLPDRTAGIPSWPPVREG